MENCVIDRYFAKLCQPKSESFKKTGKTLFFSLSYDLSGLGEALVLAKHLFSAIFESVDKHHS